MLEERINGRVHKKSHGLMICTKFQENPTRTFKRGGVDPVFLTSELNV